MGRLLASDDAVGDEWARHRCGRIDGVGRWVWEEGARVDECVWVERVCALGSCAAGAGWSGEGGGLEGEDVCGGVLLGASSGSSGGGFGEEGSGKG